MQNVFYLKVYFSLLKDDLKDFAATGGGANYKMSESELYIILIVTLGYFWQKLNLT